MPVGCLLLLGKVLPWLLDSHKIFEELTSLVPPVPSECSTSHDLTRAGPREPEVNCNGHRDVDQRQPQWKDEDQHNGNAENNVKRAREEEEEGQQQQQQQESPAHLVCNGLDSAALQQLDDESDGRAARSSGAAARRLCTGLDEAELEQSILQEEEEEGALRNGQSARGGRQRELCALTVRLWKFNNSSAMWAIKY